MSNNDKENIEGLTVSPSTGTFTISLDSVQDNSYLDSNYISSYTTDTGSITYSFADLESTGPSEWPNHYEIKNMIECYPALQIQYLKFIEVYNLVKDDYASRTKNEYPF